MAEDAIRTAGRLSSREREILQIVAGTMIPPSDRHKVPGADDSLIFSDILGSIERDGQLLKQAMLCLDEHTDGRLPESDRETRLRMLLGFRDRYAGLAGILETMIARCYYRDDRVMASISMEVRPPFPLGYTVEQGDWSLLDPVKARGKIYRNMK